MNTKEAREIIDAIDIVCMWCDYRAEDETGIDPCEGCKVIETAERASNVIADAYYDGIDE